MYVNVTMQTHIMY